MGLSFNLVINVYNHPINKEHKENFKKWIIYPLPPPRHGSLQYLLAPTFKKFLSCVRDKMPPDRNTHHDIGSNETHEVNELLPIFIKDNIYVDALVPTVWHKLIQSALVMQLVGLYMNTLNSILFTEYLTGKLNLFRNMVEISKLAKFCQSPIKKKGL